MRGSYDVVVNSRRLQYKFTIRRNVTVIRGQSATGKTTLIEMISDFNENGIDNGVTISCARDCVVLHGRNWQRDILTLENNIVFIDEGHNFVLSQDFAKAVRNSSNYYVIVTGERLENIPYQYTKSKLNPVYLHDNNKMRILMAMKPLTERLGW